MGRLWYMSLLSHSLSHINEGIVLFLVQEISAVVMNWYMGRLFYMSLLSHSLSHINEGIVLFLVQEISDVVMNWHMGRLFYMSLLSHSLSFILHQWGDNTIPTTGDISCCHELIHGEAVLYVTVITQFISHQWGDSVIPGTGDISCSHELTHGEDVLYVIVIAWSIFFFLKYSYLMHHSWLMRIKHEVLCELTSKVQFNTFAYMHAMIKCNDT